MTVQGGSRHGFRARLPDSILTLIIVPLVHDRFATARKLLAVTPSSSLVDPQAKKDLLRAEFAMTVHRLETRLAAIRAKDTALFGEIEEAAESAISRLHSMKNLLPILAYQARDIAQVGHSEGS